VLGAFELGYDYAPVKLLDDAVQGSPEHLAAVVDLLGFRSSPLPKAFPSPSSLHLLKASLPPCNKKDEGIGMSKMYDDEYFKDLGYIGDKNARQLRRVIPEEYSEIQRKKNKENLDKKNKR
jgi:hypothetical protein